MRVSIRGEVGSGKTTIVSTLRAAGYKVELTGTKRVGGNKELVEIWEVNKERQAYPSK